MLKVVFEKENEVCLVGRLDGSQVDSVRNVFEALTQTTVVNCNDLEYISSAGLGLLLAAQKRLSQSGHHLKLIHLSSYLRTVFQIAGLDRIFVIQ